MPKLCQYCAIHNNTLQYSPKICLFCFSSCLFLHSSMKTSPQKEKCARGPSSELISNRKWTRSAMSGVAAWGTEVQLLRHVTFLSTLHLLLAAEGNRQRIELPQLRLNLPFNSPLCMLEDWPSTASHPPTLASGLRRRSVPVYSRRSHHHTAHTAALILWGIIHLFGAS